MFSRNIFAVDLGTSAVKIYSRRKNRTLNEPNMIAIRGGSQVIAVGSDAFEMYEKNPPGIVIDRPMLEGRIANVAEVEMMLRLLLKKTDGRTPRKPVIYFSVPVNMSEIEKRAYYAISYSSYLGNPKVYLVERPICDALSLGVPIVRTKGSMILDIGAQSTEVSVIAGEQLIVSDFLPIGGQQLNDAITNEIRRERQLRIGKKTARKLKISLASFQTMEEETRRVTGIDSLSGLPRQEAISSNLVNKAVTAEMNHGADLMRNFLERTPPQIADSIRNEGIYLTGATARIPGIDRYLSRIIGCRVNLSSEFDYSTVRGLTEIIENKELRKWAYTMKDKK